MSEEREPVEAEIALAWNPERGDPPILRIQNWPHPLLAEVYMGGTWCPATVGQRQDWADGSVIYGLGVWLPGQTGSAHRSIRWRPGCLRPRS